MSSLCAILSLSQGTCGLVCIAAFWSLCWFVLHIGEEKNYLKCAWIPKYIKRYIDKWYFYIIWVHNTNCTWNKCYFRVKLAYVLAPHHTVSSLYLIVVQPFNKPLVWLLFMVRFGIPSKSTAAYGLIMDGQIPPVFRSKVKMTANDTQQRCNLSWFMFECCEQADSHLIVSFAAQSAFQRPKSSVAGQQASSTDSCTPANGWRLKGKPSTAGQEH